MKTTLILCDGVFVAGIGLYASGLGVFIALTKYVQKIIRLDYLPCIFHDDADLIATRSLFPLTF